MKIIISEEQKKKLFIPRKIDERDRQFLFEIGMGDVIQYLRDNGESITFDMSTTPDEWRWDVHDISDSNFEYLERFEIPIKKLFMSIAENIEGIYHIWGDISITEENKLYVSFNYEITQLKDGVKTYQL